MWTWESLASGTALARFAVQALQRETPSLLHDSATKGPLTAAHVFTAATQGDELAQDLLRREGEFLGMGLVNLLHLFSPERITLVLESRRASSELLRCSWRL